MNLTQKILASHLTGEDKNKPLPNAGEPIHIRIDQTLTQDATGTMAWLQFEALGIPKVDTDLSVSYVDHNTMQMGFRNADDHRFLRTSAAKFGAVYSPPGSGICHQLHLENFAKPGATLLGSDSHTPTAGGTGSLAIGAGGLSVALAMAGEPYTLNMPKVIRVLLTGELKGWASAKDIILCILGTLTTEGGVGRVFEYAGPGVATLSVPERATITNMGAELGATTSIFPSDERTKEFLTAMGRPQDYTPLAADPDATYDETLEMDLSTIVPLVARPHMPDRVVPVVRMAQKDPSLALSIDQVAMGSCTNSSYADLKLVSEILRGKKVNASTDVSVSPGSRQVLSMLAEDHSLTALLDAGVRVLECACGPCIGMGASPVSHGVSVRTFNRNFEGRSGTKDADVYLASPATAAFCALYGTFTDPADWPSPPSCGLTPRLPDNIPSGRHQFVFPPENGADTEILRGPNIVALETFRAPEASVKAQVLIKLGRGITTDHIMPAGAEITALRSNIPAIAEHVFSRIDPTFATRAREVRDSGKAGLIVAAENYGQGSSREHAALAPRHLGVQAVLAVSFARIHRANLVNFGIFPLLFANQAEYDLLDTGTSFTLPLKDILPGQPVTLDVQGRSITLINDLSQAEWEILQSGGLLQHIRKNRA